MGIRYKCKYHLTVRLSGIVPFYEGTIYVLFIPAGRVVEETISWGRCVMTSFSASNFVVTLVVLAVSTS